MKKEKFKIAIKVKLTFLIKTTTQIIIQNKNVKLNLYLK